jgi:hypothetical protein
LVPVSASGLGQPGQKPRQGNNPVPGPDPVSEGLVSDFDSMDTADRQAVRKNCRSVLRSPASYSRSLVQLCKLVRRADM